MAVKFKLDTRAVPDGTILLFGIRYEPEPGEHRSALSKTYTYVIMKSGGLWYVSGTNGRNPQAAGWGAVERWLERDGRVVEWVRHVTETRQLWPFTVRPHRFEASHSGMVCGAMVEDTNGNGDQCGRPAGDPVHQDGEAGQAACVPA
jgi:hypothetical protein